MGTAAYMSPEQIRAQELDGQTDLFSFGAVLYELAGCGMPFQGATPGEICGAILHEQPKPPSQINPLLPAALDACILKALEKDRALRYQSAAEIRADLQRLKRDTESGHHLAVASAPVVSVVAPLPTRTRRQWRRQEKEIRPAGCGLRAPGSGSAGRGRILLPLAQRQKAYGEGYGGAGGLCQ